MEPENKSLGKESPFGNHYFKVPAVKFRGSIISDSFSKIRKRFQTWRGIPNISDPKIVGQSRGPPEKYQFTPGCQGAKDRVYERLTS